MSDALRTISTRNVPATRRADSRQVENNAGGFVYQVDDLERLRRFLVFGTQGGTFHVGEQKLTHETADFVINLLNRRHRETTDIIVDISVRGAAPKPNPAIFALALACSQGATEERGYALEQLAKVCRTGTHVFLFATYIEQFRGWGRALRRAVADWYLQDDTDKLAYQMVKYRQREGWSHRDLLRLSHPVTADPHRRALFEWATRGKTGGDLATPYLVEVFEQAQAGDLHPITAVDKGLSWEMLPNEALGRADVWKALADNGMPLGALIRQLPRLTRLGVLDDMDIRARVCVQLMSPSALKRARIHPISLLVALRTYASGQSVQGTSEWIPNRHIIDALDAAFYLAFGAIEPAGKRTLLCLDVSGSMHMSKIAGLPLTPREASAALAMVQMATEPECDVVGFTSGEHRGLSMTYRTMHDLAGVVTPLPLSPRQRLDDAVKTISGLDFGATDCSAPMNWAAAHGKVYDTFVVYTDSETNAGGQPHQALQRYRSEMGVNAKLIVVGMTATECTIADPSDPLMLDVAGFDSGVPSLINSFSKGL